MTYSILIIGSGLAAYNLVKELRKTDQEIDIAVITADTGEFYSKPLLSTGLTKGQQADELVMANAEAMAADFNIQVFTETVVESIDVENNKVVCADKSLSYKQLVLAVGAKPKALELPKSSLPTLSVNNLGDYRKYREQLANAEHVTILGAGLVGCEFAHDLVTAGHSVDLVSVSNYPLDNLIPEKAGVYLLERLLKLGLRWHGSTTIEQINSESAPFSIQLRNREALQSDLLVVAIGLQAHTDLAKAAGIECNLGVVVDDELRSSVPNIYALGDCAEICGHNLHYVLPLMASARALAKTLLGQNTPVKFPAMPVTVKLASVPTCVAPVPKVKKGEWNYTQDDTGLEALFVDEGGELAGFVLMGDRVKKRALLTKQLPPLLPLTGE